MQNKDHMSIEELERDIWPEPDFQSSLVVTCHRLRKTPLRDFSAEDLRIMIGQNIGLKFLVPRAIEMLNGNPLACGDFYEGDLLVSVLRCSFAKDKDFRSDLVGICNHTLHDRSEDMDKYVSNSIEEFLRSAQ